MQGNYLFLRFMISMAWLMCRKAEPICTPARKDSFHVLLSPEDDRISKIFDKFMQKRISHCFNLYLFVLK